MHSTHDFMARFTTDISIVDQVNTSHSVAGLLAGKVLMTIRPVS
jgi:hypothetical protein